MNDTSLQQVIALNEEIAALAATGLPLDIGLRSGETLEGKLGSINASLASRLARGESIDDAIHDAPELPARYRIGLWAWLHHSDPTLALDTFAVPAEAKHEFGNHLGRAFFYPMLLLCLAYLGLLLLCLFTTPTIESLSVQMIGTVEPIRWLSLLREWTVVWASLFPVLVIVLLITWRVRRVSADWNWVPGSRRYYEAVAHENLAKQLAALTESGRSTDEALALLRASSVEDRDTVSVENLPSLLKWAVASKLSAHALPGVLHLVAESYRLSAERQRTFWRVAMPTIAGVAIGGSIVFAYGLAMFLPIIEMLRSFSSPIGV